MCGVGVGGREGDSSLLPQPTAPLGGWVGWGQRGIGGSAGEIYKKEF